MNAIEQGNKNNGCSGIRPNQRFRRRSAGQAVVDQMSTSEKRSKGGSKQANKEEDDLEKKKKQKMVRTHSKKVKRVVDGSMISNR